MRYGVVFLVALGGCGPVKTVEVTGFVRDGRTGSPIADALVQGHGGHETKSDAQGRFVIRVAEGQKRVRASARDWCPAEGRSTGAERPLTLHLFPRVEPGEDMAQVGFGKDIELKVKLRCDPDAVVRWRQVAGNPLPPDHLRSSDGGRRLLLKTHKIEEVTALDDRPGVVALSRWERGDYRLEMEADFGDHVEKRSIRVVAAPVSAGTFQVATGADIYLNGGAGSEHRWRLVERPEDSRTELVGVNTRTPHFRPDVFGQYLVVHEPLGLQMVLQAGAHEDVPHDCGREGCHRAENNGWDSTAHARAFRRGVTGELGQGFDERCWTCHATGVDPGMGNGGLHQTAHAISFRSPAPRPEALDALPHMIRKFGSVWCSACHGPGRILPPQFQWEAGATFQAGVCAQCHDAVEDPDSPHLSWQVREWREAPMASFMRNLDADDPATRLGCANCHSAQGFVAWTKENRSIIPDRQTVTAIACTTCHDAHDASKPHALRAYGSVDWAPRGEREFGSGAICASCHQSRLDSNNDPSAAPHAPQTDVLLGFGSQTLRALPTASRRHPHATIANSCVSCHMAAPPSDDLRTRTGGHTFSVRDLQASSTALAPLNPEACASCHGRDTPPRAIGGIRDWDGKGGADNIGAEFREAITATRRKLRERIARARVSDNCSEPHSAADFVEVDARLLLVDSNQLPLGDCDRNGTLRRPERTVGVDALSTKLSRAVWDLAMLEKDGSSGRHNPPFVFDVLRAINDALE